MTSERSLASRLQTLTTKFSEEKSPEASESLLSTLTLAVQSHLSRCYLSVARPLSTGRVLINRRRLCISLCGQVLFFLNLISLATTSQSRPNVQFAFLWSAFAHTRVDYLAAAAGLSVFFTAVLAGLSVLPIVTLAGLHWVELGGNRKWAVQLMLASPGKLLSDWIVVPAVFHVQHLIVELIIGGGNVTEQAIALGTYLSMTTVMMCSRLYSGDARLPWGSSAVFIILDTSVRVVEVLVLQGLVGLVIIKPYITDHFFLSATSVLCVFQCGYFVSRFPYHHFTLNLFLAGQYVSYLYFTCLKVLNVSSEFEAYSVIVLLPCGAVLLLLLSSPLRDWILRVRSSIHSFALLQFDLRLRLLCENQKPQRHANARILFSHAFTEPIVRIWECLYYYYYEENPVIGLIRLNSGSMKDAGWSLSFLIDRINEQLTPEQQTACKYIRYKSDLQDALDLDREVCQSIQALINSLVQQRDKYALIKDCLRLKAKADTTLSAMRKLMEKYRRDADVKLLYERFTKELLGERSSKLREKWTLGDRSNSSPSYIQSYRSRATSLPLMIVSKGPGTVLFTTTRCSQLFQTSIEEYPLSKLLPETYNPEIYAELEQSFLRSTECYEFVHESAYFRYPAGANFEKGSEKGFCAGVQLTIVPMDRNVYYELVLNPERPKKEFAIMEASGAVVLQSAGFLPHMVAGVPPPASTLSLLSVLPELQGNRRGSFIHNTGNMQVTITHENIGGSLQVITCLNQEAELISFGRRCRKRANLVPLMLESQDHTGKDKSPAITTTATTDSHFSTFTLSYSSYKSMKMNVSRSATRIFQTIIVSTLLILVIVYVLIYFYTVVFRELDKVAVINDMGRRRFRTTNIVHLARQMQLTSAGVLPMAGMPTLKQALKDQVDDYQMIVGNIREVFETWPKDYHWNLYTQSSIPIWELHFGTPKQHYTNLFEAMTNIIIHATALLNQTAISAFHPSFYYLYRNGLGETMQYLNLTTYLYSVSQIKQTTEEVETLSLALILGVHLTLVVGLAINVAMLLRMDRVGHTVWSKFLRVSKAFLAHRWWEVNERMETIHGSEELPEFPVREGLPLSSRTLPTYCSLAIALLLYVSSSSIFAAVTVDQTNDFVFHNLQSKAPYMNWSGMRRMLSTYNFVWLRELYIETTALPGYHTIVPESQQIGDLYAMLKNSTETYALAEHHLTLGGLNSLISHVLESQAYTTLMFDNPCPAVNITNCTHSIVAKGLHYALNVYLQDLMAVAALTRNNQSSWAEVNKVTKRGSEVGLGFVAAADIYDQASTAELRDRTRLLYLYPAMYLLAVVFYQIFIFRPVLWRYRRTVVGIIEGCKIVLA